MQAGAASFKVTGGVVDVGDARTPSVVGRVYYFGHRLHKLLGRFRLEPIAPGHSRQFSVRVTSGLQIRPGPCVIRVVLPGSRREFSTADNVAEIHVRLRRELNPTR